MNRSILKVVAFVVGGAALGFAYQHFIGCRSGTCAITSNPYISTAYGALIGFLAAGGFGGLRKLPPSKATEVKENQGA